jgi:hypothetical protein
MDGHQIDNVAGFAPVGGGACFVRRQVHRVQHVTEKILPLSGEESEGAVGDPFKLHRFAVIFDRRLPLPALNLPP